MTVEAADSVTPGAATVFGPLAHGDSAKSSGAFATLYVSMRELPTSGSGEPLGRGRTSPRTNGAGGVSAPDILREPLLTPGDAARLLSVKTSWVYETVRDRRLPHHRIGRNLRFVRSDLAAWVAEQRVASRPR